MSDHDVRGSDDTLDLRRDALGLATEASPSWRRCTVAIIEPDADVRCACARRLRSAGYHVVTAGWAAQLRATSGAPVAAIVVGTGGAVHVVAHVRDLPRFREAPIVTMGARARDAAGHWSCVRGGGPRGVVAVLDALLARRFGVLAALGSGAFGSIADVGARALIAHACRARLRGTLTVADDLRSVSIAFAHGRIVSARGVRNRETVLGHDALLALLEVNDAPFFFEPLAHDPTGERWPPWPSVSRALDVALTAQRRAGPAVTSGASPRPR